MTKPLSGLPLMLGMALCALPWTANPALGQSGARAEIQARYQKLINAWNLDRMDIFEAVHDPGFTSKSPDGQTMDLTQYMGLMRSERANTSKTHAATMTAGPVHSLGNNEVLLRVSYVYDTTGKDSMGMFGKKGAVHRVRMSGTMKDVWVRGNNTWLRKSSEDLGGGEMVVDGKPWVPPAAKK